MIGIGNVASAHDCNLFITGSINQIEGTLFENTVKDLPALKALTMDGLHRSLINLKTHCCASNILNDNPDMLASCKNDKILITEKTDYPQSPFLFDHLIDVMIRRLAIDGNYEKVAPDQKAKERREKKDSLAKNAIWVIPPAFSKDYKGNRDLQVEYLIPEYNGVSRDSYKKSIEEIESQRPMFAKYDERNLATKYYNLCQNAIYLMTLIPNQFKSEELVLAQQYCKKLTTKLIDDEADLTAKLIVHKSDLLLHESMKEYADEYLINTRGTSFQDKLTRMTTNLFGVFRMIPKLIPICN